MAWHPDEPSYLHRLQPYLVHGKQILVEVDDDIAAGLEAVAPVRSRQRSEFIRMAIRKALWEQEERATAAAYERQPDSAADAYVDPAVWETPGELVSGTTAPRRRVPAAGRRKRVRRR